MPFTCNSLLQIELSGQRGMMCKKIKLVRALCQRCFGLHRVRVILHRLDLFSMVHREIEWYQKLCRRGERDRPL